MSELSLVKKGGGGMKDPEFIGSFSGTTAGYHVMTLPRAISEYALFKVDYTFVGTTASSDIQASSTIGHLIYGSKSSITGDFFQQISCSVIKDQTTNTHKISYLIPCQVLDDVQKGISFYSINTDTPGVKTVTETDQKVITMYFGGSTTSVWCTSFTCEVYGLPK